MHFHCIALQESLVGITELDSKVTRYGHRPRFVGMTPLTALGRAHREEAHRQHAPVLFGRTLLLRCCLLDQ